MVNGVITSDGMVDGQRLVAIERDSIWQSTFSKIALSAMFAVGISYIAVTAILIFQIADLNIEVKSNSATLESNSVALESNSVALERLTDTVDELKTDVVGLKTDVAGLKIDMVKVKAHLNID